MQASTDELPPLGIIFDCDMGQNIDDVLALSLLYGAQGREDVRTVLKSVSLSTPSLEAAAYCEAVNRFVAAIVDRELPVRFRRNQTGTIGMAEVGPEAINGSKLTEVLEQQNADGTLLYPSDVKEVVDTADPAALIRNALTAYHDQNAIVVLTGPATNLAKVLSLNGAKELIAAKVKFLSVMAGTYPTGDPEYNVKTDIEAAKTLFREWPTPIVAAGFELGEQLPYPAESIENDFGWTENNPVVDAYRAHGEMPYDAASAELAAALYAARPDGGHFGTSEPGTIEVLDDGRTQFTPSADGKHRYLTADASQKQTIIAAFREFVSAEPAPRVIPERFRKLIEDEKKRVEEERLEKEQEAAEQ
jgi:inosine-uridine nucleoside N-ribohydrolase